MLDAATGHPLVAAPVQQQQVTCQGGELKHDQVHQYLAGADMGMYTVQPGAPLQLMAQGPAMLAQQPQQQQQQPPPSSSSSEGGAAAGHSNGGERREVKHDLSPEIASKSLSALKDRKEEILSELGDIVGSSAANAIGDMASQQAATREKYGIDVDDGDDNQNRRPSFSEPPPSAQQQQQQQLQTPNQRGAHMGYGRQSRWSR